MMMYCAFVFHSLSICNLRTEGKLYCVLQKKKKKLGEKNEKNFAVSHCKMRWEDEKCDEIAKCVNIIQS